MIKKYFKVWDKNAIYSSMKDRDLLYAQVHNELENDIVDTGIWARAFAKAKGDETKAKAYYLDLKVQDLTIKNEAAQELEQKKLKENIKAHKKKIKAENRSIEGDELVVIIIGVFIIIVLIVFFSLETLNNL